MAKKDSYQIAMLREIAKLEKEITKYKSRLFEVVNDVSAYVVPQVYACLIKALVSKYNWSSDEVVEIMDIIKELWNESVADESIEDMVTWAEQYADICLRVGEGDNTEE